MKIEKSRSERFKRKALARWRWLSERGIELDSIADELGVEADELRSWIESTGDRRLLVPVQIIGEVEESRGLVVVLRHGIRIEGMSIADVVELARRLS